MNRSNNKPHPQAQEAEEAHANDSVFPEETNTLAVASSSSTGETSSIRRSHPNAAVHVGDQTVAWVKLLQPSSGGADGGKFLFTATGEIVDSLYIIPTLIQPIRTLWPIGGFSRDKKP
jgi:hypothetical protein